MTEEWVNIASVFFLVGVALAATSPIWLGISLGILISAELDGYRDAAHGTWERDSKRGLARWAYMKGREHYARKQAIVESRHERRDA